MQHTFTYMGYESRLGRTVIVGHRLSVETDTKKTRMIEPNLRCSAVA